MILSKFAESLSELMFNNGITVVMVCEALGCGDSLIYRYLRGQSLPTPKNLVKLADYFNCSSDYLLGLEESRYEQTFLPCPPFKERIPFLCQYYKISRYRLIKDTGISESVVNNWVYGHTQPSVENIVKVAEYFGCTVDNVLGRTRIN